MNKILKIVAILLIVVSINSCQEKSSYTFKGELSGIVEKGLVRLVDPISNEEDTAEMVNGNFVINGQLEQPKLYRLYIAVPNVPPFSTLKSSLVYIENGQITCTGNFNEFENYYDYSDTTSIRPVITGSEANVLYEEYLSNVRPYVNQAAVISMNFVTDSVLSHQKTEVELQKAHNNQRKLLSLQKRRDQILNDFILKHSGSQVAYDLAFAAMSMDSHYEERIDESIAKAVSYYESISIPDSKKTANWISALKKSGSFNPKQIDTLEILSKRCLNFEKGAPFMDGKVCSINGDTIKLSSQFTEGNYTLIDFWASWCGYCRDDIPHIKKIYQQYHSKGLDVISVSADEINKSKKAWLKAMEQENMPWPQYQADFNSELFTNYDITGIPYLILIDPNGNIVKAGIRGYNLDIVLEGIFNRD